MNCTRHTILFVLLFYYSSAYAQNTPAGCFDFVKTYPFIHDSTNFINCLKTVYGLPSADPTYKEAKETISRFDRIKLEGCQEYVYIVEYSCKIGPMIWYPFKDQLVFNQKGRLLGTFHCVRYDTLRLFKDQNPYLLTVISTPHGNGWHVVYRCNGDSLIESFSTENRKISTFGGFESKGIYEPRELTIKIIDENNDSFNDIEFSGKIKFTQALNNEGFWYDCANFEKNEKGDFMHCYDEDNPWKVVPVRYVFIYDQKQKRYFPKEDYVKTIIDKIKP